MVHYGPGRSPGLPIQILAWGGERSPPIGGGPKGGDKGPMGGDWRVICDKINGTKKFVLTYDYELYFGYPTQ